MMDISFNKQPFLSAPRSTLHQKEAIIERVIQSLTKSIHQPPKLNICILLSQYGLNKLRDKSNRPTPPPEFILKRGAISIRLIYDEYTSEV